MGESKPVKLSTMAVLYGTLDLDLSRPRSAPPLWATTAGSRPWSLRYSRDSHRHAAECAEPPHTPPVPHHHLSCPTLAVDTYLFGYCESWVSCYLPGAGVDG